MGVAESWEEGPSWRKEASRGQEVRFLARNHFLPQFCLYIWICPDTGKRLTLLRQGGELLLRHREGT